MACLGGKRVEYDQGRQGGQVPPQSMSTSVSFLTPSVQVAIWHMFAMQTALAQSVGQLHVDIGPHFIGHEPPQS